MKLSINFLIVLISMMVIGCSNGGNGYSRDDYESLASAYLQQELYVEAIQSYEAMLTNITLETKDQAKINYRVGDIYYNNLKDFRGALAAYTAAKTLGLPIESAQKMGKKMVSCLENMGRSLDASRAVANEVNLESQKNKSQDSIIVAKIGATQITLKEIEDVLGELPKDSLQRKNIIYSYVNSELIAKAARRKGIANQPNIKKKMHTMQNQVLIQASLAEEMKKIKVDPMDVKTFFEAQKAKFTAGDTTKSFKDVQKQVEQAYMRQKQQSVLQQYTQQLMKAENVQIFDNRF